MANSPPGKVKSGVMPARFANAGVAMRMLSSVLAFGSFADAPAGKV